MKPENTRSPYLLPDGEPTRCSFLARADAPIFWEKCEQLATEKIDIGEADRMHQWMDDHPRHTIMIPRGPVYLCDAHVDTWRGLI
jgi:hypothetical protein